MTELTGDGAATWASACHAHLAGTDHFAEAVITGTAVALFADRGKTVRTSSVAVLPLDATFPGR